MRQKQLWRMWQIKYVEVVDGGWLGGGKAEELEKPEKKVGRGERV